MSGCIPESATLAQLRKWLESPTPPLEARGKVLRAVHLYLSANSDRFVVMSELEGVLQLRIGSAKRRIREAIESLRDLGYPVGQLPGPPFGPGYRMLLADEPEVKKAIIEDYRGRIKRMSMHLAIFDKATAEKVQLAIRFDA
jgi:hypothetical protein